MKTIIGSLRHVYNDTTPSVHFFGHMYFGGGISLRSIIVDQADIGWTNFLCGRWSLKWKEVQKRHYLQMNKRKSARLWTIAILEKLLLIQCYKWQFRDEALHSLTGTTSLASHHSLNYRRSKEKHIGTDGINQSSYHLFSKQYTLTKLQSSSITNKNLWPHGVSLERKEYNDPDDANMRQAISQRNQMQSFLITNGPLLPIIPRKTRCHSKKSYFG